MNFVILRTAKLSSNGEVAASMEHSMRNAQNSPKPPNADPTLAGENELIGKDSFREAYQAYRDHLPERVRKNGVRCIEYLVTASPEAMNGKTRSQQDDYLKDSIKWLEKNHGAENVICAAIHRDELTPHMHVYVVPYSQEKDSQGNLKKPGKLNCREFLGGAAKLTKLQTDFAKEVGGDHGLKRGEEKSRATHETVKDYYKRASAGAKVPEIPASEFEPRIIKSSVFSKEYEGGEQIKERIFPKFESEVQNIGAMWNEARAKEKKAVSAKAKAEKALSRMKDNFKGMEAYPNMTDEEKGQMQRVAGSIIAKRLLTQDRNKDLKITKKKDENER